MASSVQAQGPADQARAQPGRAGARRVALAGYRWLLLAFLLGCAAQIFLAGLGVFSFGDQDAAGGTSAFNAHMTLGFALAGVAVILLILALIGRPGVLAMSLAGVLVIQTCLLQSLLDSLADGTAAFGGLHALDGLLIVANAGVLYALALRRRR
ncbi:MAG TPA: hypothetical protein VGG35_13375 [Streptosporangiaceae bacterium]|jgi:hypothetical protein